MLKYLFKNIIYLFIILISLITLAGAGVYYFYALNNLGVIISLALALAAYIIILTGLISKREKRLPPITNHPANPRLKNRKKIYYILLTAYCLLFAALILILLRSRTDIAIISPWQVIPGYFFLLYFLATTVLFALIYLQIGGAKKQTDSCTSNYPNASDSNNLAIEQFNNRADNLTIFISLHCFLSFSIAAIIYKIGYGFDPFIHEATLKLIDKIGAVEPKPLYYLGQYSLITIFHKIFAVSIAWLNKLLVPALAAITLPYSLKKLMDKWFTDNKFILLTILILLALPFSIFIISTPQNFAYLFLILTIIYGFICTSLIELIVVFILALAAFSVHPLAGIPALMFALALTIYHSDKLKIKKYLLLFIFIVTAFSLPLIFYFLNINLAVNAPAPDLLENSANLIGEPHLPRAENFILNFIYLYAFNLKLILVFLAAIGLALAYRYRQTCRIFFLSLGFSFALLVACFLTNKINFDFLINYERENYAERMLLISLFFILPFFITSFYAFFDKIMKQAPAIRLPFLFFTSLLITASLYLSYPRLDNYYNSHGYSTSQADIDAVHWIENSRAKDYLVLANQQLSAAALREFGFDRYLNKGGEPSIYFYPIPTGGRLYQYYLTMVYNKPTKKTMVSAMEFAGVNEAYFILNKYWWAFPKVLAEAKLEADSWQEINQGEIYIFKYEK